MYDVLLLIVSFYSFMKFCIFTSYFSCLNSQQSQQNVPHQSTIFILNQKDTGRVVVEDASEWRHSGQKTEQSQVTVGRSALAIRDSFHDSCPSSVHSGHSAIFPSAFPSCSSQLSPNTHLRTCSLFQITRPALPTHAPVPSNFITPVCS